MIEESRNYEFLYKSQNYSIIEDSCKLQMSHFIQLFFFLNFLLDVLGSNVVILNTMESYLDKCK